MNSKIKIILAIITFIVILTTLNSETIIDSVYSVPELDGDMCYTPTGQFSSLNTTTYSMYVGDLGTTMIEPSPPPNSTTRAFLSFELPEIPVGYEIDSVYVRLYQFDSLGGYPTQWFPIWNVTGGDSIKCILSHIDYGSELDWEDWTKGDIGNPDTFTNYVGIVSESEEDGYRLVDVTDCVIYDYHQGRSLSQYRISFQLDTDLDDHPDYIGFNTSESLIEGTYPTLFFCFSNDVGLEDNITHQDDNNFFVYPNPISENGKILLKMKQINNVNFKIFNIKGQLVQTIYNGNVERGEKEILLNTSNLTNGIYLLKAQIDNQNLVKKIIIMK